MVLALNIDFQSPNNPYSVIEVPSGDEFTRQDVVNYFVFVCRSYQHFGAQKLREQLSVEMLGGIEALHDLIVSPPAHIDVNWTRLHNFLTHVDAQLGSLTPHRHGMC